MERSKTMRKAVIFLVVAASFLILAGTATLSWGNTYSLQAAADSDVWLAGPNGNYGSNQFLEVRYSVSANRYPYLRFDLPAIPPGEVITGATLHLNAYQVVNSNNVALSLYHVSDDTWTESGITWNNKPGYDPDVLADVTMATMAFGGSAWGVWDLNEYNKWTPDTDGKVSLLLMCPDTINTHDFWSRDFTNNPDLRPYLVVTTSPVPLPGAAWLLGSGLLGLAGWRRLRKG
jgi:hypothetical protein